VHTARKVYKDIDQHNVKIFLKIVEIYIFLKDMPWSYEDIDQHRDKEPKRKLETCNDIVYDSHVAWEI
jgi:hypothetical protein